RFGTGVGQRDIRTGGAGQFALGLDMAVVDRDVAISGGEIHVASGSGDAGTIQNDVGSCGHCQVGADGSGSVVQRDVGSGRVHGHISAGAQGAVGDADPAAGVQIHFAGLGGQRALFDHRQVTGFGVGGDVAVGNATRGAIQSDVVTGLQAQVTGLREQRAAGGVGRFAVGQGDVGAGIQGQIGTGGGLAIVQRDARVGGIHGHRCGGGGAGV